MTQVKTIDTLIENIKKAAAAKSELLDKTAEEKRKLDEVSMRLNQGIHEVGDAAKLAVKLAPLQTERMIREVRVTDLEKESEPARLKLLSVCRQEAAFVQRAGREFLDKELATRYPKILALFHEWGIPAEVYKGFPIATGCNNDSLRWCRDLIEELGDFVNRAEHGRDVNAADLINTIERCRCWFPDPVAAEETTASE